MMMQLTQIMTITLIILVAFCGCGPGFYFYKAFRIKKNGPKWLKRGGWFLLFFAILLLVTVSFCTSALQVDYLFNKILN